MLLQGRLVGLQVRPDEPDVRVGDQELPDVQRELLQALVLGRLKTHMERTAIHKSFSNLGETLIVSRNFSNVLEISQTLSNFLNNYRNFSNFLE